MNKDLMLLGEIYSQIHNNEQLIAEGVLSDAATKAVGKALAALAKRFPSLGEAIKKYRDIAQRIVDGDEEAIEEFQSEVSAGGGSKVAMESFSREDINTFRILLEDKPTLMGRGIDWLLSKLPNPIKNALVGEGKFHSANLLVGLISGIAHVYGLSSFAASSATSVGSMMAGATAASNPALMLIAGAILVASSMLAAVNPSVRANLRNMSKTEGPLHSGNQWSKEEDPESGELNFELNHPKNPGRY